MPPKKRKFMVEIKQENSTTMIDTTPLETIDVDGDLILQLTYARSEGHEDEAMSDVDMKTEAGAGSSREAAEKWEAPMEINLLVSSKHLMLASPSFKEMFRNESFRRDHISEAGGRAPFSLPGYDPDAFRIVLNIVHGRTRQVPLEVTLGTFVGIGDILKKYKMMEVAELYVKIWMEKLPAPEPQRPSFGGDVLLWLAISRIFDVPDVFKRITRLAIWETSSKIEMPASEKAKFPVLSRYLDEIESTRKHTICKIIGSIQSIIDRCTSDDDVCPSEVVSHKTACNAMLLGSLLKNTSIIGLWPFPEDPYPGLTLRQVIEATRGFKIVCLCDVMSPRPVQEGHGAHGYMKLLAKSLEKRATEADGLSLDEFLSKDST